MASVLKRLTGVNPLTLYAPRMSQRLTLEEEDPLYRFATSRGLLRQPTVFVTKVEGRLLGSDSFDAYIFWPRISIEDGRPDWMVEALGRKRARIPSRLLKGTRYSARTSFPGKETARRTSPLTKRSLTSQLIAKC